MLGTGLTRDKRDRRDYPDNGLIWPGYCPARFGFVVSFFCGNPVANCAICQMFTLPERRTGLEEIHDEGCCLECSLPVAGRGCHQNDRLADGNHAVAMNDDKAAKGPARCCLGSDTADLGFRHARIMLQFQCCKPSTFITAQTCKTDNSANIGAPLAETGCLGCRVECLALDPDIGLECALHSIYPPVIGGNSAISLAPSILSAGWACS